jgi:hypothetical protein
MSILSKFLSFLRPTPRGGSGSFFTSLFSHDNEALVFNNSNAYTLAKTIAEVYNPIDIIADRVSSVPMRYCRVSDGKEVTPPVRIQKLLKNPNSLQQYDNFAYESVFTLLAQGGANFYRYSPLKTATTDSITSVGVLDPSRSFYKLKNKIPATLDVSLPDIVEWVETDLFTRQQIPVKNILFVPDNGIDPDTLEYYSPLNAAARNINNLLMVYQARYNQYKNNGSAGILTRKSVDYEMAQFAPNQRQEMIDELNKTDGIVGKKNFIGISATPMEFIKTIGTISELMPFEETRENQLKIAGVFNIDKDLLPLPDGTTFTNKESAERFLWQNIVCPYAKKMGNILTALFLIPEGYEILPDFSGIEILQQDRKTRLEGDLLEIELIKRLQEVGIENKELLNKWKN